MSKRVSLSLLGLAFAAFVGIAGAKVYAQGCCQQDPAKCTAFSLCFDNGFCLFGNKCNSSTCSWDTCPGGGG